MAVIVDKNGNKHTETQAEMFARLRAEQQAAKKAAEEEAQRQAELEVKQKQYQEYENALGGLDITGIIDIEAQKAINAMASGSRNLKEEIEDAGGDVFSYDEDTSNMFTSGSTTAGKGNTIYSGQSTPTQQNAPSRIDKGLVNALLANGNGNKLDIVDSNGNVINSYNTNGIDLSKGESAKPGDIVVYGGVSYIVKQDGSADRLIDYNNSSNRIDIYSGNSYRYASDKGTIDYVEQILQPNGEYKYIVHLVGEGSYETNDDSYNDGYSGSSSSGGSYRPKPEPPPIVYKDITLYSYQFGIDGISMSYQTVSNKAAFVSDYIDIGTIHDINTISLEASEYVPEHTSIEYYIIDGNKTIPIINRSINYIEEELLFPNIPTRFPIKNNSYVIKKNFEEINIDINDIDFSNKNDIYTISYAPAIESYKPESQKLKVKAILRRYLDDISAPYIHSIKLIKSGGGLIWEDTSLI